MTYTRIDHSDKIIHFTKNSKNWNYENSYKKFNDIINQGFLKQSANLRLDDIPSICFTEASYAALTETNQLNKKYFQNYSPFGFMFTKKYIYSLGGLPVIYSPREDFEKDNEKTNWRTVTYNPIGEKNLFRDFTWEREWRIKPIDKILNLDPKNVKLVFPSKEWAEKFRDDHDEFHKDESCDCICTRKCETIEFDKYSASEISETIEGTCVEDDNFPWILLNLKCNNIPSPK